MTKKGRTLHSEGHHEHHEGGSLEHKIVENLINLQKVHVDLAEKFDKLAKEISNLLELFELTAKNFSTTQGEKAKDKEFLEKIDKLLEQNRTIAKSISLMDEKMKANTFQTQIYQPQVQSEHKEETGEYIPSMDNNKPLPRF